MRSPAGNDPRSHVLTAAAALAAAVLLVGAGAAMACRPPALPADRFTQTLTALDPGLAEAAALGLDADAREVLARLEALTSPPDTGRDDDVEAPPWGALARAYDTPWPAGTPPEGEPDDATLRRWRAAAAERIRAYAILVESESASGELAFLGAYWISPLIDRLRVVRPPEGAAVGRAPAAILGALETCAVEVEEWIVGDASLAQRLVSREGDGFAMFVVGWRADTNGVERAWVAPEDVLDALQFDHPATRELTSFSAWFSGSGPGPVALARAIPALRSSMGPRALLGLFREVR